MTSGWRPGTPTPSTARRGSLAGIAEIGQTADVIGVQELNPERRRDAVERALPGFGVSRGNNSVQILWRNATVELIAQDSVKVFGVERMESGVAGTSIGPKSIQWVQLRQRSTGAVFFVVNHHIVPSIENGGRPDDRKPRRIALYQRQMDALTNLVTKLRSIAPVMVTGDFNVDARADARVQRPALALHPARQPRACGRPGGPSATPDPGHARPPADRLRVGDHGHRPTSHADDPRPLRLRPQRRRRQLHRCRRQRASTPARRPHCRSRRPATDVTPPSASLRLRRCRQWPD